jgi:CHAD domain-containing protein
MQGETSERPLSAEELARISIAQLGARVILEQVERALKHEAGARLGEEPEELHKMRVATRRMRVAFSVFGNALRAAGGGELPRAEVKQIAGALGAVRDLDVFIAWLDERASEWDEGSAEHGAIGRLRRERVGRREAAREAMRATLDGEAMRALRGGLRERLRAIGYPPFQVPGDGVRKKERADRVGQRLMERARRRLIKRGRRLFAPTVDELHAVRIAAKKLRYVCEFVGPAVERRSAQVEAAVERATAIQDALGELHDADVAETRLLDDVVRLIFEGAAEDAAVVAGLVKAQRTRRLNALHAFREEWKLRPRRGWLKRPVPTGGNDKDVGDDGDDNT